MKKVLLFTSVAAILFTSCGSKKSEKEILLTKKWNLKELQIPQMEELKGQISVLQDSINAYQADSVKKMTFQTQFDALQAQLKSFEEGLTGSYVSLKEDGSYEVTMMGKTENGTWQLTPDQNKLVFVNKADNKADSMQISEVSADKLTFTKEGASMIFESDATAPAAH